MLPYFEKTSMDIQFYKKFLKSRLPAKIFDVHVHINLKQHVENVPEEKINSDWALQCGIMLPWEDAYNNAKELFPDAEYTIAGFPWPINEADIEGNNGYLAGLKAKGKLHPFMGVRPEWDCEDIEKTLMEGGFAGFKPYPDMVAGIKGADISIYEFLPQEQLRILNRHKKTLILHLPRKGRLADDKNVRELMEIRQEYPDIVIIIAHFGRSFCPIYLKEGIEKLKGAEGFYFDTAAVINPEVYDYAFNHISSDKILYGTDAPIFYWHGKRKWTEREYHNLCRESYKWNKLHELPEVENKYTFFLYEQMRSILDSLDKNGMGEADKEKIFYKNTIEALKIK